ncbi:precorrin-3B synthase [Aquamicrobium lusatiense]|uniref:Precorrin-3B synthase n=1 Tax=Aquamicrobium lusatiense TaxID=89772 RepID=A0A7W9S3A2_9HYPH|nr:precorrin-3B synthase [Aquamicrobium lusatiense]MBB6013301.1 precorrin-3B synthase [Aquamicrobium lusatiense]
MSAFARRGACPALSTPMQTGDGLLARLNTIAGGLPPKALIGLCESALRHGNGIVEVTARGSIQIRGLTPQSAQALARDVDALEIEVRSGVPVETGPLAGIDAQEISDPRPLANEIRAAIEKAGLGARLGPKVSVVVDGGGLLPMDGVSADVRLTACRDMVAWHLSIGGTAASARPLGFVDEAQACAATILILEAIATLGREARARDLDAQHIAERTILSGLPAISPTGREKSGLNADSAFAAPKTGESAFQAPVSRLVGKMAGQPERGNPQARPTGTPIAVFPLVDGTCALGIALPFGSMPAENIIALAQGAITLGATEIRPAPSRALLFPGMSLDACETLRDAATSLGFITEAYDPRLSIAACPGAPACASGRIATRALAERIAAHDADLLDGSFTLHVSGCAKGCAHPAPAAITLVGHYGGAGIALDGSARSPEASSTVITDTQAGMERIAALARRNRRSGETVAACLARLGAGAVTNAFVQG